MRAISNYHGNTVTDPQTNRNPQTGPITDFTVHCAAAS